MNLFIDYANLISFVKAGREEESAELYSECMRLLKKQMHLCFNFSKSSLAGNPLLLAWANNLSKNRGRTEETDSFTDTLFPARPIKTNFRTNLSWAVFEAAYLLDDEKVESIKQLNSTLIGAVGEELPVLARLFCTGSFDLHSIYDIQKWKSSDCWQLLVEDGHILPCSDIVIMDRYLFDQKQERLEKNVFSILRLFAETNQKMKVNIVFFCDKIESQTAEDIKRKVETLFGFEHKKPLAKVTFVMYENNRPHDRIIITNYRLFRSGDSFNYFDENGMLATKGKCLDVDSTANVNVSSIVDSVRKDMNSLTNILLNNHSGNIVGAKESNFIDFGSD